VILANELRTLAAKVWRQYFTNSNMDRHEIPNHYKTLGLNKSADADEVRKAFQTLAKELHPDINPSPAAAAQFSRVKEAYDVLRDVGRRNVYDKTLDHRSNMGYDPEALKRRAEEFNRTHRRECPDEAGAAGSRLPLALVAP
jgi:DnaJ-class molecular chaperone